MLFRSTATFVKKICVNLEKYVVCMQDVQKSTQIQAQQDTNFIYTPNIYIQILHPGVLNRQQLENICIFHIRESSGYWIIIMFNRMTKYYTTVSQSKYTKVSYLLMYFYTLTNIDFHPLNSNSSTLQVISISLNMSTNQVTIYLCYVHTSTYPCGFQ